MTTLTFTNKKSLSLRKLIFTFIIISSAKAFAVSSHGGISAEAEAPADVMTDIKVPKTSQTTINFTWNDVLKNVISTDCTSWRDKPTISPRLILKSGNDSLSYKFEFTKEMQDQAKVSGKTHVQEEYTEKVCEEVAEALADVKNKAQADPFAVTDIKGSITVEGTTLKSFKLE